MASFVFVHGAWHGAWCWAEVTRRLSARGHACHAVDLPGVGDDPSAIVGVTLRDCVDTVVEAVRISGERVWLVAHSAGGVVATQACEAIAERLAGVVYVTALLPRDGQSGFDVAADDEAGALADAVAIDLDRGLARLRIEQAGPVFYQLCDAASVQAAQAWLQPWQALAPSATPLRLTPERGSAVPRFYVECLQDQAIPLAAQRRMHAVAGVRGVRALDADHSPFLCRPDELANALESFLRA